MQARNLARTIEIDHFHLLSLLLGGDCLMVNLYFMSTPPLKLEILM